MKKKKECRIVRLSNESQPITEKELSKLMELRRELAAIDPEYENKPFNTEDE